MVIGDISERRGFEEVSRKKNGAIVFSLRIGPGFFFNNNLLACYAHFSDICDFAMVIIVPGVG
jgi:hypothetical protein